MLYSIIILTLFLCFKITQPFLMFIAWGIIIAVALYPVFKKITTYLNLNHKIFGCFYIIVFLSLLIIPTISITDSLFKNIKDFTEMYNLGDLPGPANNDLPQQSPLEKSKIQNIIKDFRLDFENSLKKYKPQIKQFLAYLLNIVTNIGFGLVQFILSIIISGILLIKAEEIINFLNRILSKIISLEQRNKYINLSEVVIRSIALGVIGVAFIQALLSGIGMFLVGVPGWAIWTVLILFLSILQISPIFVLSLVCIYLYSEVEPIKATLFMIWSIIIILSELYLKPKLFGANFKLPIFILLSGAIGGLLLWGVIGLFVGAVILVLTYQLILELSSKDTN